MAKPSTVSEYIAAAPANTRSALRQIRRVIRKAAPGITERISYRIARFDLDGKYLLYMAAFKSHVGIYPVTGGMTVKYGKALKPYRSGAATLRFAPDRPLPLGLISKLAKQRVLERRAAKAASKPRSRSGGRAKRDTAR
jgi:uncharacterized protein YdhG (YjbR/CyaY superfamily)